MKQNGLIVFSIICTIPISLKNSSWVQKVGLHRVEPERVFRKRLIGQTEKLWFDRYNVSKYNHFKTKFGSLF